MTTEQIYTMFKKETRVQVVGNLSYKKHNYVGEFGTIVENLYNAYGKIAVSLDTCKNPTGRLGYFYFRPLELALVDDNNNILEILEENDMQNVTNYLNIANIKYLDSDKTSIYNYANFDPELKEGDLCVVKSLNHGLGLARVTEIVNTNDAKTPREIVAKVDTHDYDFRVASRKNAAELKAKMQERAKQLQDIALYQMLAEKDPEMKELIDRYQSLPTF